MTEYDKQLQSNTKEFDEAMQEKEPRRDDTNRDAANADERDDAKRDE